MSLVTPTINKIENIELNYVPKDNLTMDETEVGKDLSLFDYAYGYCHLFAAALNKEFGYGMRVIWNENRQLGKGVVHAYAAVNYQGKEFLYDAHGLTDYEGIKIYLDDEIEDEVIPPVFKTECYDDAEAFIKEYLKEFELDRNETEKTSRYIKDAQEYLKRNMRMYLPQYAMTIELAKRYNWEYKSEGIFGNNECKFVFENDEEEILEVCVRKDQSYRLWLYFEGKNVNVSSPNNFDSLIKEFETMLVTDYK